MANHSAAARSTGKFLRIDSSLFPQIANVVMDPSFAKEIAALIKREREAAYEAGRTAERVAMIQMLRDSIEKPAPPRTEGEER